MADMRPPRISRVIAAAPAGKGVVPAGFPRSMFLGVTTWRKAQFAWIGASGVPWGAVYQYLDEGVNTGRGWAHDWGPAFAADYVRAARRLNLLPVFTYYQLLQSAPHYNMTEAKADLVKLNNAATMKAYYADFTTLLRQLAQVGGPVVIHVEPDLWGYLEATGLAPNALPAAVASSGTADLARYPNTVAGFGAALLHLRDRYAPQVVMAAHVSTWTWSLNTKADLDVAAIARRDAAFMSEAGDWDLFFTDLADRDAAWYQFAGHDHGAHWWDPSNRKFPNFQRLLVWADAFTSAAHRRLVLWQLPIGNKVMDSCNNTSYHYQDNRAQYWLENYPDNPNLAALARVGVIGLLFGSGGSTATDNYDVSGQGVYNPRPINGNTERARFPDDDGGYLRLRAERYYRAGPVPIP